jgi:Concanavalin A-like lectin/glucanases superfamily
MKQLPLLLLVVLPCVAMRLSGQTLPQYQSTVSSQTPFAYFKLDNSLESAVNPSVVLEEYIAPGGGFGGDVFRNPTNSYYYVNSPDFLRNMFDNLISGGTGTATGSITFLFRTLDAATNTGQRYLFSAGGNTATSNAFLLFFENDNVTNGDPNSLKLRFGDTTMPILDATNILPDTWYYFALTYSEARSPNKAIWYLGRAGGVLETGMTTNADGSVAGDGLGVMVVGNNTNFNSGFRNPGNGRIDEFAIWHRELSATEITNQFSKLPQLPPPGATYDEVVSAEIPSHFFKLDDSFVDSVGGVLAFTTNGDTGAFTTNLLGDANHAYTVASTNDALVLTTDIINGGGPGPDASATGTGSISLLFRMLSDTNNTGQRYLFGQGNGSSGTKNQFGCFIENTNPANGDPNSLKLRIGNGPTTTILYATNIIPDAWYYLGVTWDETRNSAGGGEIRYYVGPVGGTLDAGSIDMANDAVVGDNGTLYLLNRSTLTLGFENPGQGAIDDFATWDEELSPNEIAAQFAAAAPPPTLKITRAGANVVLSWPSATSAGFVLESTVTLNSPSWTSAGIPVVVGSDYVVTNALGSGTKFYRLHIP